MPGRETLRTSTRRKSPRGWPKAPILLVDVREPNETDVERYPEAVYMPMSEFDPSGAARSRRENVWSSRAAPATAR